MKPTKFAGVLLIFCAAACAQSWDSSGNGMLKGSYYFRQVFYQVGDYYGDLSSAVSVYGSLTFDGAGNYTGTVSEFDNSYYQQQTGNVSGTYSISASGYGFITIPVDLFASGEAVYGLVNQSGIFVGSSTENVGGYNDMFVAAPIASPAPTIASFKGSYTVAGIDLSSLSPSGTINYLLQMNPDGNGNLGTVTATVYVGQYGTQKYTQTITGAKYIASGGAMVVSFPNSLSNYITGQRYFYISPDGNFVFGGSPGSVVNQTVQGWDMFVGVRTTSTNPSFGGLYYQAGLDQDETSGNLDTYYGSFSAGNDAIIGHQRLFSVFDGNAIDYTYSDSYSALSNSSYSTSAMNYAVGQSGIRVGSGIGYYLGINVAIPAPSFSGSSGPYLNPTGVVNAASYAPFTAGLAPGELITLYGTGLADSTVVAPQIPFPTSLGNVQVSIGGVNAPIYYVSPTQISVIVPYEATASIVQIQVTTDGNPSNTITAFTNSTSAGVFSLTQNGIGDGAILHQNGSTVTSSSPAQPNETVSVYLTGLGAVSPAIADGAAGPSATLSNATNTITADVSGVTATVTYAGLAPGFAGLYQVNVTIPSTGLTAGPNNFLDIGGPDSYTSEVLIPIGGGSSTDASSEATPAMVRKPASTSRRMPGLSPRKLGKSGVANRRRVQ